MRSLRATMPTSTSDFASFTTGSRSRRWRANRVATVRQFSPSSAKNSGASAQASPTVEIGSRVAVRGQHRAVSHADHRAVAQHRERAVRLPLAEMLEQRLCHRHGRVDAVHLARHHLFDRMPLQRIDAVLAVDVIAAARDLLGEDRAAHRQHGEAVGHGGRGQQRQQRIAVVREPEGEDSGHQRRAHHAAQRGRHADQRPQHRVVAGQHVRRAPRPGPRPSSATAPARRPRCRSPAQ